MPQCKKNVKPTLADRRSRDSATCGLVDSISRLVREFSRLIREIRLLTKPDFVEVLKLLVTASLVLHLSSDQGLVGGASNPVIEATFSSPKSVHLD